MRKYFHLQWKRISKYLVGAICVVLILMGGLVLAFSVLSSSASGDDQKIQVALCGDVEDPVIQMGLAAVAALDSSRFSIAVEIMSQDEAAAGLEAGDLAVYVVVPEGFLQEAFRGNLLPMKMVTTAGSASMVSILKEEITQIIAMMVIDAQKGVFGLIDSFEEFDVSNKQELVDGLAFEYVDFILTRGEAYALEELGIADDLRFSEYLLCGLTVLLVMLACLPFAPLLIRRDHALGLMLAAKGKSLWLQGLCQFGAYVLGLLTMFGILLGLAFTGLGILKPSILDGLSLFFVLLNVVPVIIMAGGLSYLLYGLSGDLISGVLLQFFVVIAMCFVSGCMYPVYFFPLEIQKMAAYLPTGIARGQLAGIFTREFPWGCFCGLMAFGLAFLAAGIAVRVHSTKNGGR